MDSSKCVSVFFPTQSHDENILHCCCYDSQINRVCEKVGRDSNDEPCGTNFDTSSSKCVSHFFSIPSHDENKLYCCCYDSQMKRLCEKAERDSSDELCVTDLDTDSSECVSVFFSIPSHDENDLYCCYYDSQMKRLCEKVERDCSDKLCVTTLNTYSSKCISDFCSIPSQDENDLYSRCYDLQLYGLCEKIEKELNVKHFNASLVELEKNDKKITNLLPGKGLKRQATINVINSKKRKEMNKPSTSRDNSESVDLLYEDDIEMEKCTICNIFAKRRYFTNHSESNIHKNNSLRIDYNLPNVSLIETAFCKRVSTYRIMPIANPETAETFIDSIKDHLKFLFEHSITQLKTFKVNFIMQANFIQPTKKLHNNFDFQTTNYIINQSDDINTFVDELKETISGRISAFDKKGSGWSIKNLNCLDMNINLFDPMDGKSFIELPYDIKNKKAVINVKNTDNQCLKWALLSGIYPVTKNSDRVSSYVKHEKKLNLDNISFPVQLSEIQKVEQLNNISINVFGLEYNIVTKSNTVVGPLYFTKSRKTVHINLLYITNGNNGHYCFIKNLSRLVRSQITSQHITIHICDGCLLYFKTKEILDNHKLNDCIHVRTELPNPKLYKKNWFGKNVRSDRICFDNYERKFRVPFVIYADFNSFVKPKASSSNNPKLSTSTNIQRHDVYSFGYYIKCSYNNKLSKYVTYGGENCANVFMKKLYEDVKTIWKNNNFPTCPLPLNDDNKNNIQNTTVCYICEKNILEQNIDYDFHTGEFKGVSHESCSKKLHKTYFLPIIVHNLGKYSANFILDALNFRKGTVQIIPQNKEKYISLSKILTIDGHCVSLRFIDSFKFLNCSLQSLASDLNDEQFSALKMEFPYNTDFILLKKKSIFPFEFLSSFESLKYPSLPTIDKFLDSLTGNTLSIDDYTHAKYVWDHFKCQTMADYSDLYLKTNVLILNDIFENLRNVSIQNYHLDPAHYYTAPSLSWDAMLKYTKVELELLTDFDKLAFIKSGIRFGLSQCINSYAKANNPYMKDFKANEPISYLTYLDANNLYGWAMSQYLPLCNFQWERTDVNFNVPMSSDNGYILEVDLEYPDYLHDKHSDFPLCAENLCVCNINEPKLVANLNNKKKYVIHYRNLIQCLEMGLKLTKVHRVLKFNQSPWLKSYIELNTLLRTSATSAFEKDFYKLMNNSIFGKTLENIEKRVDVKLLTHWEDRGKTKGAKSLIARPEFHSLSIFSENLVAVQLRKSKVLYDKPIYLGFSILDISKTRMYDFHYKYMRNKFENLKLLYTDTDSFIYQIYCTDFYKDIKSDLNDYFDTSDYLENNVYEFPLLNKKKIGFFKDENCGKLCTEFVGLRSKIYAIKVENETITKANGDNKNLTLENYKSCLVQKDFQITEMNRFRSLKHSVFTHKINKNCSSCYNDDKRCILVDSTETLAWGHYRLRKNCTRISN